MGNIRALQLRREARMVSPAMGAAMIGTLYFLRANCAQHGGKASGGRLISASLLKLQGSRKYMLHLFAYANYMAKYTSYHLLWVHICREIYVAYGIFAYAKCMAKYMSYHLLYV